MCQNTVINVSEFCHKTVRCKYLSELYQKSFGNASEMCHILKMCQKSVTFFHQKSVRNLSEVYLMTYYWHIYNYHNQNVSPTKYKCVKKKSEVILLTDFILFSDERKWPFSDTFLKSDTFLMHFQNFSDRILTDICIRQFSDRILIHLWRFSDTFL